MVVTASDTLKLENGHPARDGRSVFEALSGIDAEITDHRSTSKSDSEIFIPSAITSIVDKLADFLPRSRSEIKVRSKPNLLAIWLLRPIAICAELPNS